ncbi:MAG: hypothetical protein CVU91_01265 [Firmicutes bacterium HGW-Firmicutes-16]|nr:MAG: hypothetical protein CVU91_01265 [Firmicutes bacterium HGW-Firmicutes-16]
MQEILIAPCGMNCELCIAYQAKQADLKKHGFNRKYCEGCIPRGQNCLFMSKSCEKLANGQVRYCSECDSFPCKRLKALDKRYRTKYNMSMIENLIAIRDLGMEVFLRSQEEKWACQSCGGTVSCHTGLCARCDLEKMRVKKAVKSKPLE